MKKNNKTNQFIIRTTASLASALMTTLLTAFTAPFLTAAVLEYNEGFIDSGWLALSFFVGWGIALALAASLCFLVLIPTTLIPELLDKTPTRKIGLLRVLGILTPFVSVATIPVLNILSEDPTMGFPLLLSLGGCSLMGGVIYTSVFNQLLEKLAGPEQETLPGFEEALVIELILQ